MRDRIRFVVQPLPGTQEQLYAKLRGVADTINRGRDNGSAAAAVAAAAAAAPPSTSGSSAAQGASGSSGAPPAGECGPFDSCVTWSLNDYSIAGCVLPWTPSLSALEDAEIRQIEVGPSHFAFLLADGRICRLPFSVISDRLDLNRGGAAGTSGSGGSGAGHPSSSGGGGGGQQPPSGGAAKAYKTPPAGSLRPEDPE